MSSFKKTGPTRHTGLISKAILHIESICRVGIHKVEGDTEKRPHCHTNCHVAVDGKPKGPSTCAIIYMW